MKLPNYEFDDVHLLLRGVMKLPNYEFDDVHLLQKHALSAFNECNKSQLNSQLKR